MGTDIRIGGGNHSGGVSEDIVVSTTNIINGTDGGLFFNDNGVFEEMNGIKFDNDEGMFYNDSYSTGGLKMSNIEIIYMGSPLSLPCAGIYGFPDSNNKPYFNGYADGSLYGLGKLSTFGWMDLLTGNGTYIQVKAENNVNLNAENNVNINAENNVNINALGDNSNLWANFGNGNSQNTEVSFTINTSKNNLGSPEQYVFKQEDERFNLISNNNSIWTNVFSFDLLNKKANMNGEVICQELKLDGSLKFGQQLSTGTGATVDDLITVLQGMGILTQ